MYAVEAATGHGTEVEGGKSKDKEGQPHQLLLESLRCNGSLSNEEVQYYQENVTQRVSEGDLVETTMLFRIEFSKKEKYVQLL